MASSLKPTRCVVYTLGARLSGRAYCKHTRVWCKEKNMRFEKMIAGWEKVLYLTFSRCLLTLNVYTIKKILTNDFREICVLDTTSYVRSFNLKNIS